MDNPKYSDKYEVLKNKIQPILDNCNVFADQKRETINQLFKTAEETYSESDLEELESKLAEIKDLKIYGADYDNWSKKYDELSNTIKVKAEEQRKAKQAELDNASLEQKNALRTAKSYLNTMSFSRSGLIEQLEYEQYSSEAAVWAVDHVEADWNEQAAKKAKEYLDMMAFSRRGLIDQLKFEGFTEDEAEYGATSVGY